VSVNTAVVGMAAKEGGLTCKIAIGRMLWWRMIRKGV